MGMTQGPEGQGNKAEGGGDRCRYGGRTCGGLGCWADAGEVVEEMMWWIAVTNAHPSLHYRCHYRSLVTCAIDLGRDPNGLGGRELQNL